MRLAHNAWLLTCFLLSMEIGGSPLRCPTHCQSRINVLERRVLELQLELNAYAETLNKSRPASRILTEHTNHGFEFGFDAADSLLRSNTLQDVGLAQSNPLKNPRTVPQKEETRVPRGAVATHAKIYNLVCRLSVYTAT